MSILTLAKNSRFTILTLIFLQLSQAMAGTVRVTNEVNGRSSLNFKGRANVRTLVPQGTEGTVLERWEMPSGNYGIKMRVTTLPDSNSTSDLKIGEEVWVYYHRDGNLRLVELYDDEDKIVSSPEEGAWAVALQSFKVSKPAKSDAVCDSCNAADPTGVETVSMISAQIIEATQEIPEIDVGVEELVTYLNQLKNQPETNRRIARAALKEAKDNHISPTFVLGVISAESSFKTSAVSHVGARGLMQLMPAAWTEVMGKGVPRSHDIEMNIRAGVRYLAKMLERYDGDEGLALYAYKNGSGNVNKFLRGNQKKSSTTITYQANVKRFQSNYLAYQARSGTAVAMN